MNAIVEIDKSGRIVVPKKLRDELHLTPGTRLRIERAGEQIVLEQDYPEPRLELRDGLLVMVGGPPIGDDDVLDLIDKQRERRMRFVSGLSDEP
jgi:AbrB family looped-hinge helix DNA binding protein